MEVEATSQGPPKILVVDDDPSSLCALEAALAGLSAEVVMTGSAHEALDLITSNDFAVILLDVRMPVLDGFQIAARIRERPRSRETPIIFITGLEREEKRGYEAGGVDFLVKPVDADILRAKANAFVQLARKAKVLENRAACLPSAPLELERQAREHTAPWLDREQAARAEAATAYQRVAFLAEASRILVSSLNCEDTVASLAQWVVAHIADWCIVDLVDGNSSFRRLNISHSDPSKVKLAWELEHRYAAGRGLPFGPPGTLRERKSEVYPEISDSLLELLALDAEHLNVLRGLGLKSYMGVPLLDRGQMLGAVTFLTAESGVCYGAADLTLAEDLAHRASLAIDNARLYQEAQEANRIKEESEKRFRALIEKSFEAIALINLEGTILYASPSTEQVLGYSPVQLVGRNCWALVHPEDLPQTRVALTELAGASGGMTHIETRVYRKDGSWIWAEGTATNLLDDSSVRAIVLNCRDITDRRHKEEDLRASLAERNVLLKEIHHRVKNNLQIISSLLNLQARQIQDDRLMQVFAEAQNRIRSMALMHSALCQSGNVAAVDLSDYLLQLTGALLQCYGVSRTVHLTIHAKDVTLPLETAVPCGFIVNELVSNALKHAFPGGRRGEVRVDCRRTEPGGYVLTVSDNGIGCPQDLDFHNSKTLGLQLVVALTEQLNGAIELRREGGTSVTVNFREIRLSTGNAQNRR